MAEPFITETFLNFAVVTLVAGEDAQDPIAASHWRDSGLFLIDIPTAAKLMSMTVFAVRELCRSRELSYVVIGHKWLLSPDAIRAFIRKRELCEEITGPETKPFQCI